MRQRLHDLTAGPPATSVTSNGRRFAIQTAAIARTHDTRGPRQLPIGLPANLGAHRQESSSQARPNMTIRLPVPGH